MLSPVAGAADDISKATCTPSSLVAVSAWSGFAGTTSPATGNVTRMTCGRFVKVWTQSMKKTCSPPETGVKSKRQSPPGPSGSGWICR